MFFPCGFYILLGVTPTDTTVIVDLVGDRVFSSISSLSPIGGCGHNSEKFLGQRSLHSRSGPTTVHHSQSCAWQVSKPFFRISVIKWKGPSSCAFSQEKSRRNPFPSCLFPLVNASSTSKISKSLLWTSGLFQYDLWDLSLLGCFREFDSKIVLGTRGDILGCD